MARIVAVENVTLDGVMQAPGTADEDRHGGFEHGGWAQPYGDEVSARGAAEGMAQGGALLFGRYTYELLMRSWGGRDDNPFSPRARSAPQVRGLAHAARAAALAELDAADRDAVAATDDPQAVSRVTRPRQSGCGARPAGGRSSRRGPDPPESP
jgi:hypothetical protein